jgi:pimeloyl-ACP methyl ester carboxylesterase
MPPRLALAFARRWAARDAWVYDPRCDDRVLDFVRFCIRDIPAGGVWSSLRLAFAHDTRASLGSLSCRSLLLVGERESLFAREAADELAHLIPGAELRISPGVSHLHPLSSSEWFVRTVSDWLDARIGP